MKILKLSNLIEKAQALIDHDISIADNDFNLVFEKDTKRSKRFYPVKHIKIDVEKNVIYFKYGS
jgi:hypothetical protein